MCTVIFEDIVCRGRGTPHDKYRLVIAAGDRQEELKSTYLRGADVFGWRSPFEAPISISNAKPPLALEIELRAKGWRDLSGHHACSFTLNLTQDCKSAIFNLKATRSSMESPPELSVTATVVGLGGASSANQPAEAGLNVTTGPSIPNDGRPPPESSETAAELPSIAPGSPVSSPSQDNAHSTPLVPWLRVPPVGVPTKKPSVPLWGHPEQGPRKPVYANRMPDATVSLPALSRPSSNDELLSTAQDASRAASREQSSIRTRSLSISSSAVEAVAPGVEAAGSMMWSGVSRLDAVVDIINVAADIHPLVKGAWSLLNVAYTLAKQQSDLDIKIEDLVHALDANCEFAQVLADNELEGVAESIVRKILGEVLNGAALIKEYCTVRKSRVAVFKFAGSGTSSQVDACLEALNILRRDLGDHITAEVHRDLNALSATIERDLSTLKAKIDRIDDHMQAQETQALLGEMQFAPEANRAMRSKDGGCLPHTRGEIIDSIVNWAIGAGVDASQSYVPGLHPESRVLWLCGVAGSGKSSIAISVARALRSMDRLGAFYGFETAQQGNLQLHPTNLFSTIARQLAGRRPHFRQSLIQALERMDPDVRATTSVAEQFKLFLSSLSSSDAPYSDVVIIDAFDEAGSPEARKAVLHALTPKARDSVFPHGLRFIITSRYDPDVAKRLESLLGDDVSRSMISFMRMDQIKPAHTQRDIKLYVNGALGDVIDLTEARDLGDLIKLALAAKESFLWASTACRYIVTYDDRPGYVPAARLKDALATGDGLDGLYRTILDRSFASTMAEPSESGALRTILGTLVCSSEPVSVHTICALAGANTPEGASNTESYRALVRKLASLVTGTHDPTAPLIPLHTSFTDFLRDPKRSLAYTVSWPDMQLQLSTSSIGVMKKLLRFNICGFESSFLRNSDVMDLEQRVRDNIPPELSYACRFWPAHVTASLSSKSAGVASVLESFPRFLGDKMAILEWLEVMSLTDTDAQQCLRPLASLQVRMTDRSPAILCSDANLIMEIESSDLSDVIAFATYFAVPLRISVPHIYLSALAFAPSSSLFGPLTEEFPNLVHADAPLVSWPRVRHSFAHKFEVQCVAFSPDGKYAVSGEYGDRAPSSHSRAADGAVNLWDVYSGRRTLPRMATNSAVLAVALSPDGKLLATGHFNGKIILWDVRTLLVLGDARFEHMGPVGSVAFAPGGAVLASGSMDQTVMLWDVQTGAAVGGPLKGHRFEVTCVAFSPNGALLASCSLDRTIRLWDARTLSALGDPLRGHTAQIYCVAFSPDSTLLASGSGDRTVRLWDVRSQSALGQSLAGHEGSIRGLAFSSDGACLASSSDDMTLRLWDVRSRSAIGAPLNGHTGAVRSVAFSPNGDILVSASPDRTLRVWDAQPLVSREGPRLTQLTVGRLIACSPLAKLLATESSDRGSIRLWDARTMCIAGELSTGPTMRATSLAFSTDGLLLASGTENGEIQVWDTSTCTAVAGPLEGQSGYVSNVTFSPDGTLLVSGSSSGTITVWDIQARYVLVQLAGHSSSILSFAFSGDGTLLASGSYDRTIRLWDVHTCSSVGKPLKGHLEGVGSVALSSDGALLASGSSFTDDIWLWDVHSQSTIREPFPGSANGRVMSLAFSPDGALLASATEYGDVVRIWDVCSPPGADALVAELRHTSCVMSVHFPSDVPLLTTSTTDGAIHTWAIGSLEYLHALKDHQWAGLLQAQPSDIPSFDSMFPSHMDLRTLSPECLTKLDDGWVTGPNKELVLWIPPVLRPSLSHTLVTERFGGISLVRLVFSKFVCGSDWTNCYSPPSSQP